MKKVIIGYSDVYQGFNPTDNIIYNILKKKYNVEILDTNNAENKDKIQYLIYSAAGTKYLDFDCIRIFVTGENLCPDFNLCDYAIGFEHMEFGDRFFRVPIYLWRQYSEDYDLLFVDRIKRVGSNPEKRNFCSIVVSNNLFADPFREDFFRKLSEYKKVDSGGKAYNNIGKPNGVEDKRLFLSNYKFNIAFENSSYPGYCTEKIIQAFAAGNVPIYWGDPTAVEYFNEKAFINCCGLSIDEAINKVIEIDRDDDKYIKMLSEPLFVNSNYREITLSDLEKWLFNIFDSDYEKARRRPVYGKMAVYNEVYTKRVRRDEMLRNNKITLILGKIILKLNGFKKGKRL